jgi:hypothetical protein
VQKISDFYGFCKEQRWLTATRYAWYHGDRVRIPPSPPARQNVTGRLGAFSRATDRALAAALASSCVSDAFCSARCRRSDCSLTKLKNACSCDFNAAVSVRSFASSYANVSPIPALHKIWRVRSYKARYRSFQACVMPRLSRAILTPPRYPGLAGALSAREEVASENIWSKKRALTFYLRVGWPHPQIVEWTMNR